MDTPNNQSQTLFGTIRSEINDFVNNYIEVVPGYNFNQYETIKRIHLYLNSRFYDQSLFSGREKIFMNIVKYRKDSAATLLDIDTKDCRVYPLNPKSAWSTFFLEKELQLWLKKNNFSKTLNEMADEGAAYGTVLLKKTKKGAQLQDLRRVFLDPTCRFVKDSRFVTIKHYFTPTELRKKAKDGWDKGAIEAIIEKKKNQKSFAPQSYENYGMKNPIVSTPLIEVYERYGEIDAKYYNEDGDPVRSLVIVAEPFAIGRSADQKYEWDDGSILFKSKWLGDYPFNDFHYSQTRGRWLGVGVVEELFPVQERFNEMANQKRVAMEVSAMHLFQTADSTVVDNILTDLQSGDVIKVRQPGAITPIANEERNMQAFGMEEKTYDALADKISFVNDIITGSNVQSSTPATSAAIANTNAKSYFRIKRQNFAIFIREYMDEFVLPQVVKEITPEHVIRFTGDVSELQKLDDAHTNILLNNAVIEHVLAGGDVPNQEELVSLKQGAMTNMKKLGGERFVEFVQDFFGDTDFEFDILLDEEQEPIATLAQNTFQLLTAVAQNPQLLENPVSKALIYDWAQKVGINPVKLEMAESQQQPQQMQQQPSPMQNQLPQQKPVTQNG